MAVPQIGVKHTYEDYRRTPDDERFELLNGEAADWSWFLPRAQTTSGW